MTNADGYWIEIQATGVDASCAGMAPITASVGNVTNYTFTWYPACNTYRVRVLGLNTTCGVDIGTWSNWSTFTLTSNINGRFFLDPTDSATVGGAGTCTLGGATPTTIGNDGWIGAVTQAGWTVGYNGGLIGYGITGPTWIVNPGNAVGLNPGTALSGNRYICTCPAGCNYANIATPQANVDFFIRECTNPSTCIPACGQSDNCGGYCPNTDAGGPSAGGIVMTPADEGNLLVSGTTVPLSWTAAAGAEAYNLEIEPTGTAGSTCDLAPATTPTVNGATSYNFTFRDDCPDYRWRITPVNTTCGSETGTTTAWSDFHLVANITGTTNYDVDGDAYMVGNICVDPDGNTPQAPGSSALVGAFDKNGNPVVGSFGGGGTHTTQVLYWPSTQTPNNFLGLNPGNDGLGNPYRCSCPSTAGCGYSGIASPQNGVNFFFTDAPLTSTAWWQTVNGNAYAGQAAGTAMYSVLPTTTCVAPGCVPYLSTRDSAGTAGSGGVFLTGGGNIDTDAAGGNQSANLNEDGTNIHALGTAATRRRENYAYFYRIYSMGVNPTADTPNGALVDLLKPASAPTNQRAYYYNGNATISQAWNVAAGESYVIFINGNLTLSDPGNVEQLIQVQPGGFLAFIVSGNITFDQSLGNDNSNDDTPNVEGYFIANGTIATETGGASSDQRFVGAGSFVGWTGIDLNRVLVGAQNNSTPAEQFVFRPDFVTNIPARMSEPGYLWQETN